MLFFLIVFRYNTNGVVQLDGEKYETNQAILQNNDNGTATLSSTPETTQRTVGM